MYTTHTDYEKWSKTRKGQPTGKDCEKNVNNTHYCKKTYFLKIHSVLK